MIMYQFAEKLGFGKELVKNYKMQKVKGLDEPVPEDILREINRSSGPSATPARAPSG
jgi:formate dehydrogenase major subunit